MSQATLRLEGEPAQSTPPGDGPPLGTRMGRYVVLSTLGMGTMGVVVAAYDPELDRKAALKLLRSRRSGSDTAQSRLAREAQALAKLNHPNVVTIYDVGTHEGQVFVAMEFVQGVTLREWMATPRSWADVVRVFVAAGRGLAAAHEVGLVHRDFKPENVMIDVGERVRVMDFGLARAWDDSKHDESSVDDTRPLELEHARVSPGRSSSLSQPLTQTGMLLGTPAYMAPEQWRRHSATPRSDQFAFCAALYEALYGRRPFVGDTIEALRKAVLRGEPEAPAGREVPPWVRRIVMRGLASDASRRHDSMQALLDALTDDPRIRRRRWGVRGLIGGLALAAAWGLVQAREQEREVCTGGPAQLERAWNEPLRRDAKAAMLATGLPYAADMWARIEPDLDAYAEAWVSEYGDACEATRVRAEQSEDDLSLRMSCLHGRWLHLRATVDELRNADASVVENAVEAVANLPSIERCRDLDALRAEVPPPDDPAVAEAVAALDERLIEAAVKREAGKYDEGLRITDEVVASGLALGYEPLLARAWLQQGLLHGRTGDYEAAVALLRRSYAAALAHTMTSEAAEASATLVIVLGVRLARSEDARHWAEHAEPLSRAAGPRARATYLNNAGAFASSVGDLDEANAMLEQALALREAALGPEHPDVATTLNNLAGVAFTQGDYERALRFDERALDIRESVLGPEHPDVAISLSNLASVEMARGNYEPARTYFARALTIQEQALGPAHPAVAASLHNLGALADSQHETDEALGYFRRSLAIREQAFGPDHPTVAISLNSLGVMTHAQGNRDEARGYFERSLAISEAALGREHPSVAHPLMGLGELFLELGQPERARPLLERALDIRTSHAVAPELLATARFMLARALVDDPSATTSEHERARSLAEQAHESFAGSGREDDRVEVETWLAAQPGPRR